MEPALALKTSAVILALAAVGGIVMAMLRSIRDRPPSWLAMAHGLLAGSGLTLLLYVAFTMGLPKLTWVGVVVLIFGAAVGIRLNLGYHEKMLALPVRTVIIHGFIAFVGLVLVALGAFNVPSATS